MAARRRKKIRAVPEPPREARKVYVETSVWGMTLDNQPRALRQPTQQFLRQCGSGVFLPYVSTVVFQEIARADESQQAQMLREISSLAPISLGTERGERGTGRSNAICPRACRTPRRRR